MVNSYLIDMSNLMVVLNSSCNFLIYYAFGEQFRRLLKSYIKIYFGTSKKKLIQNSKTQQKNLLSTKKAFSIKNATVFV